MFTIMECITDQHERSIVLLATSTALVGMLAFFHLLVRVEESSGGRRRGWIAVAAATGGLSVWATHFLAMLAYRGLLPIGFDFPFTAISAVIAIAGFWFALSMSGDSSGRIMLRAAIITATVGIMHLTGMAGMKVAARIDYTIGPIMIATVAAFLSFLLAFALFVRLEGGRRIVAAASGAILGICTLHFAAMQATILTPDPSLSGPDAEGLERLWLTGAISGATLLVLVSVAIAALIDRYVVDLTRFANATLDGLAFVHNGRIVEVNARFASLLDTREAALIGQNPNALLTPSDALPADAPRAGAIEATPRRGDMSRLFELAVHTVEYRGKPTEVIAVRDLSEKQAALKRVEYLARYDMLTGLANRALFQEQLELQIDSGVCNPRPFALLALDLDRFKAVNDLFGHAEGDRVLKDVAAILRECVRPGDTVARLGGDEFMIILTDPGDLEAAGHLATDILSAFRQKMDCTIDPTAVGVSIGIAAFPKDGEDTDTLMRAADLALYRAKVRGRGVMAFYDRAMDQEIRERRQMEADLRQAIDRNEIQLLYQPMRSVGDGEICGYEALVRWQHPVQGQLSPKVFLPIAEDTGVIIALGEWVLREACRTASRWPGEMKIAVNVSPVQFRLANLAFVVSRVLDETGLSPNRLELEITESVLLRDRLATLETLRQIKALGVAIVMDDFGTGYSSLSNLQSFPFDKIKIDRSFIAAMGEDEHARSIMRAVVGLGRSLALPVTAEGIETPEQYNMVADEGCTQVQGYLFGKPNPAPCDGSLFDAAQSIA